MLNFKSRPYPELHAACLKYSYYIVVNVNNVILYFKLSNTGFLRSLHVMIQFFYERSSSHFTQLIVLNFAQNFDNLFNYYRYYPKLNFIILWLQKLILTFVIHLEITINKYFFSSYK